MFDKRSYNAAKAIEKLMLCVCINNLEKIQIAEQTTKEPAQLKQQHKTTQNFWFTVKSDNTIRSFTSNTHSILENLFFLLLFTSPVLSLLFSFSWNIIMHTTWKHYFRKSHQYSNVENTHQIIQAHLEKSKTRSLGWKSWFCIHKFPRPKTSCVKK